MIEQIINTNVKHKFLCEKDILTTLNTKHFKYLNDIKRNLKDKSLGGISKFFDVDFYLTDTNCSGFCDFKNKIIAIHESFDIESFDFKQTLTHELSHIIQVTTEDITLLEDSVLLSDRIRLEQQCEAISCLLQPILFGVNHEIDCYNDIDSVIYLNNWYGNYLHNDLLINKI